MIACAHLNVNTHREGADLIQTCRDCSLSWIQIRQHLAECNINTYGWKQVVSAACTCGE